MGRKYKSKIRKEATSITQTIYEIKERLENPLTPLELIKNTFKKEKDKKKKKKKIITSYSSKPLNVLSRPFQIVKNIHRQKQYANCTKISNWPRTKDPQQLGTCNG